MTESAKELKPFPAFGSKDWANYLLREGIHVLQDWDREPGSRALEVLCTIDLLEQEGFWWQARTLRSWLHKYWNDLRPSEETSDRDFQTSSPAVLRPEGRPPGEEGLL